MATAVVTALIFGLAPAGRFANIYRGQYPRQFDVHLDLYGYRVVGRNKHTLYTLLGAVGLLLLLIACANVANLLLAKAGAREKELATGLLLAHADRALSGN